ncbi:hypothetical protein HG536_0H01870 [Torulaspora globosa]|uniref:Activator of C kinase protein 1 n=1 Tax=Torulaspora globosa TaxID=48254 RepID=A0A7G3ZMS6_9SACH|nr:uncharacterized protein HG536_0H01870 [Torulaspora globosa]QLL34812.1 hypothetical protein HG536_0H01870 [Torulaspora globosa]
MYREQYHENRYEKHIKMFPPGARTAARAAAGAEPVAPYPLDDVTEVIGSVPAYKPTSAGSSRRQAGNGVPEAVSGRYDRPFQIESERSSEGQERVLPPPYEESETRALQEKAYRTETDVKESPPRERRRDLSEFSPSGLKFYEIYSQTVADSAKFTPEVQMKWCETLLEYAFDDEFLSHYNINAEKLKRELRPEERQKNQKVILEHSFKVLAKLIGLKWGPALYLMGTLYSHQPYLQIKNKHIVARNDERALEYYGRAAGSDHADACYRAGVCYELRRGVPPSTSQDESLVMALNYYRRGADLCDNSACMYKLGMFYLYRPQFQDAPQAIEWFKRASRRGDSPQALYELGKIYEFSSLAPNIQQLLTDNGVKRQPSRALKCFYKCAIDCDYPLAQWKLGHCYEFGELHLPVVAKKSIAWYAKAALAKPKGNAMAMLALSGWYLTGATGVLRPNDNEAFRWARESCTASDGKLARAEYALAYYYENSIGCPRDLAKAKSHYQRAASIGHPKAINRLQVGF